MHMLSYIAYSGERCYVGPVETEQDVNALAELEGCKDYEILYLFSADEFRTHIAPCPEN